jgi:orotate phosphoribosyltransferase
MRDLPDQLIDLTLSSGVLCFGRFTLKSGRTSPYFFDLSRCATGRDLVRLAGLYARALVAADIGFDMLFGPAYKGIPLAAALAMALAAEQRRDVPFCFNRKEAKDHGEGGLTFGAPLQGRVVIVDDVVSAGTSINASVEIIRETGAEPVACIVALDRRERGAGDRSAAEDVGERHGIKVVSIATLDDVVAHLASDPARASDLDAVRDYRTVYGAS